MNKYKSIETILQCPITKEGLVFVESVRNTDTHTDISSLQDFESGFLNTSRTIFYPLIHGIIFLMPEYCISNVKYTSDKMILSVQEFYNTFGWTKTEAGNYIDEVIFTDHRDIARDYKVHYAERIAPLFKKEGKYLLDIASGPVYQEPYKRYSDYCEYRICIDISVEALKDAQKNLDINRTFFIVGDITNIPLKDSCCDNIISNHTVYHVPKHMQLTAVHELVRVCAVGSRVIISYNWGWHSMVMNVTLFPFRLIRLFRRLQKIYRPKSINKKSGSGLYFYAHSPGFFRRYKPQSCELEFSVLTALHEDFIKVYLSDNKRSRKFLSRLVKWENRYPEFFGRNGAFGLMIYKKHTSKC